ncbi:MAG: ScpA family protein [Candidatus Taylorbacteria bacterium]
MPFTVKTTSFEGPLDLLLDLIEKRKLFINDVSLAKVTDDFIAHVKQFDNMPMGESAHFILVASTLLLIKSKSLLPDLNITEEEKGDMNDLETRLKIYQRMKEASKRVNELFGGDQMIFEQSQSAHSRSRFATPVFVPNPEFTLEKARMTLADLINRLPKKEKLPQVIVQKVISLEETIVSLTTRITSHLRMSFKEFTKDHKENRVNVIVSFLAMLELVKQGIMHVTQESTYGDINMETKDVSLPRY